jgi:hypothetical protein
MPAEERPIPFRNFIYFGDGDTDVPSMAVTREQGGYAMAVYGPHRQRAKCQELLAANRIDFFAPADYRKGRELWKTTTLLLDRIIASIFYDRARYYGVQNSTKRRRKRPGVA